MGVAAGNRTSTLVVWTPGRSSVARNVTSASSPWRAWVGVIETSADAVAGAPRAAPTATTQAARTLDPARIQPNPPYLLPASERTERLSAASNSSARLVGAIHGPSTRRSRAHESAACSMIGPLADSCIVALLSAC